MAGAQLDIDMSTIFDDIDARQVAFAGEVDGEVYQFAVQYSVLEAISGSAPDGNAASKFNQIVDIIKEAALSALSRDSDPATIVVTESDLDR